MRDLILIAAFSITALIALRRPVFGLLMFTSISFLNPQSYTWGARNFPLALITAIGTLVGYLFWGEQRIFPRQRESVLVFALWCMFGISTVLAIYPDRALGQFIHVSKILMMFFLSTVLINNEHRLQWFIRVIALCLGLHGAKGGMFALATGGEYMVWGPEQSFLYANTSIGLALVMNIPLLLYLLKTETISWLRWIIRMMIVLSYPAVVCTYSRGAWLGLVIVSSFLILRSRYRRVLTLAIILGGLVVSPFLYRFIPERLVDRYDSLVHYEEEGSAQSRFWNWEFARRVGFANPLHGGGFDYYSKETYAIYFPEFLDRWQNKVWSSHSIWYTMLGEHGFPGLILWLILNASCFFSLIKMRLQGSRPEEASEHLVYCANMLLASFIGFIAIGSFIDVAYFDLFYYLVAMIIVLKSRFLRKPHKAQIHPLRCRHC